MRATLLVLSILASWLVVEASLPPRLAGTDVFHFKDAGCRFADGGGFKSSSYDSTSGVEPLLYSVYAPLYPATFGVYAAIVGCGAEQNRVFELLLSALLGIVTAALFWPVFDGRRAARLVAVVAIAATAPIAGLALLDDRPEPLALLLLACQWLLMVRAARGQRLRTAYLAAAVVFLASFFVGLMAALLAYLFNLDRGPRGVRAAVAEAIVGLLVFGCVLVPVCAAFLIADRQSLARFAHYFSVNVIDNQDLVARWSSAWLSSSLHSVTLMTKWTFVAVALVSVTVAVRRGLAAYWRPLLFAYVVLAFPFARPAQNNYFLAASFMTLVCLVTWNRTWQRPLAIPPALLAGLVAAYCAIAVPELALSVLMRIETASSNREQTMRVAALKERLTRLTPDRWLLIPHSAYFFYRPYTGQLFDVGYQWAEFPLDAIAGVVVCDAGQPADVSAPPLPPELTHLNFEAVSGSHPKTMITLFGRRIMRRQWGALCTTYFRAGAS